VTQSTSIATWFLDHLSFRKDLIGFNKNLSYIVMEVILDTALNGLLFLLTTMWSESVGFSRARAQREKNCILVAFFHKFLCPSKDPKKNVSEDPLTLNEEMYPHRSTKSFEFLRSHEFSHDFPVLDTQYIEWKTVI
jgi:hypothetical protein